MPYYLIYIKVYDADGERRAISTYGGRFVTFYEAAESLGHVEMELRWDAGLNYRGSYDASFTVDGTVMRYFPFTVYLAQVNRSGRHVWLLGENSWETAQGMKFGKVGAEISKFWNEINIRMEHTDPYGEWVPRRGDATLPS